MINIRVKEEIIRQARLELARRDFFEYCKLTAGDFYKKDRLFLQDMCYQLQDFYQSNKPEDKIMVMNLPPRHGKSRTAGKLTEWVFGKNNHEKVMTGSYNETLSGTFAKSVRDTIASEKTEGVIVYNDIFPNTKIKEDYLLKTKNMNKDIIYANYQQEPIDVKNRLYSGFKTYDKLPPAHYIMNYTDTADEGEDYLCSIDYQMYNNSYYILDVIYTQDSMETTEPAVAKMLTKDHVGFANIESNNGGRGFARNVQKELRDLKNYHTKVNWFHQSENKIARILSNSTAVMNNVYFPLNWEDRWPEFAKHLKHYLRSGKNEHDDAEDCLTGVYEHPKPNTISFGYNSIM